MKRKLLYILLLFFSAFLFCQPKRYVPYGGQRLESPKQNFSITRAELYGLTIRINFSLPVEPSSITKNNIYINEERLPDSAAIKFDRSGKTVEITLAQFMDVKVIEFRKALSFNKEILLKNKVSVNKKQA